MVIYAGFFSSFWPKATATAYYNTNCLPTKALNRKTPYKVCYKKKSDLSNLLIYNYNVYVNDYHIKFKGKIAQRAWIGILVEYKKKINRRSMMVWEFLFIKMLFLMSQSLATKTYL